MRRDIARGALAGIFLLGLAAGGCGDDRVERGLAPADEASTPESSRELDESAAQRKEQNTDAMQGKSDAEFDATEDGAKPPAP